MAIHKDIKNRIAWFKELQDEVYKKIQDPEIAKQVLKTIMFEENYKGKTKWY